MNKSEQKWQAQDDARIMAQYQEILADKSRLNRAVNEAKKQAADLNKRVTALNAVAKQGTRKASKKK